MPRLPVRLLSVVLATLCVLLAAPSVHAAAETTGPDVDANASEWVWPLSPFVLDRPYVQPAHRYGAGHRGIDLRPVLESEVLAPAAGIVAFAGNVADRSLVTIDHGNGLVTTLEPVDSGLVPGMPVESGAVVGTISLGGHAAPGSLHFGVRLDGEYINPLLLYGGVPRAVLLPCCE
jgi:murein DD-endopeptidase MepM/ murein hydrolase activator NlpD